MARRTVSVQSSRDWILRTPPALPNVRALLTPIVAHAFQALEVSVSFWNARSYWHPIYEVPTMLEFEMEHGAEAQRWPYNDKQLARARDTGSIVCGEHAGFNDLFAPLIDEHGFRGAIVAGPLSRRRPTSAEVRARWQALARKPANLTDPGFAQYLSATLATLTLEGPLWDAFERLLRCFTRLVADAGDPSALYGEANALRLELLEARFEKRMWDAVRSMLNERRTQTWAAPDQVRQLWSFGLDRIPEHVVVGLMEDLEPEGDPLEAFLRQHELQRAATKLARRLGGCVCGQVGGHGVVFLVDARGPESQARARSTDVATRAQALARRFGFRLRVGLAESTSPGSLVVRYLGALGAAERALSQRISTVKAEAKQERSDKLLRTLRRQLVEGLREPPGSLVARFEQYAEAAVEHAGYRIERVRPSLEAGLERLGEALLGSGALDERSFDELWSASERWVTEETTAAGLVARYRQLVEDLARAVRQPATARQGRGVDRALGYMRDHLSEDLTLERVAKVAGFAPDHFSRLFKQSQQLTFQRYLQDLRIERSKQILAGTSLRVEAVSTLSGFKNRMHFHRLFKRMVGLTPVEYRTNRAPHGVRSSIPARRRVSATARKQSHDF